MANNNVPSDYRFGSFTYTCNINVMYLVDPFEGSENDIFLLIFSYTVNCDHIIYNNL